MELEVTKDEFWARINPMDVVLRSEKMETIFETRHRQLVGRKTPGYMCQGPTAYFLVK